MLLRGGKKDSVFTTNTCIHVYLTDAQNMLKLLSKLREITYLQETELLELYSCPHPSKTLNMTINIIEMSCVFCVPSFLCKSNWVTFALETQVEHFSAIIQNSYNH